MGYDAPYGTGDRTEIIVASRSTGLFYSEYLATNLINGTYADNAYFYDGIAVANHWIKFDFTEAIVITEIKWYQSGSQASGTWKVQGSNNDADWIDIGSSFTLGVPATQTIDLSGNTTAYRYYRLLGVSGNASWNQYLREIEFSWAYPAESDIKSVNGIVYANIKSVDSLSIASIKKINSID